MPSVEDFIAANSRMLLRSAWLLTGDWASAEDLVQVALLKSWQRWESIEADAPEVYVRRVLVNTFLSWRRRRWNGERPVAELPERAAVDELSTRELRHSLRGALLGLPVRQRAVVVLRYFNDLSEAQTADVLGCSIGNVKSQAHRALNKLRAAPELRAFLQEVAHD